MTNELSAGLDVQAYDQRFLSYSGTGLPLNLVSPISEQEIENRNTWFGACVDDKGRIFLIHKLVYGSVELSHRYGYAPSGNLAWAEIRTMDDEARKLWFDEQGKVTRQEHLDD